MCKGHTYFTYLLQHTSAWILIGVVLERVVSVCYPFKRRGWCTIRNARIYIGVSVAMLCVIDSSYLFTMELLNTEQVATTGMCRAHRINDNKSATELASGIRRYLPYLYCERMTKYFLSAYYAYKVEPLVDYLVASFLPSILIITGNCLIIFRLRKQVKQAKQRHRQRAQSMLNPLDSNAHRQYTSITVVMILASVAFFLLTTPLNLTIILWEYMDVGNKSLQVQDAFYLSYAISMFFDINPPDTHIGR